MIVINGILYAPVNVCGACIRINQSVVIEPVVGDAFQIKFTNGDRSYREDIFKCIAADDRTVVGEFLTRPFRYGTTKPQTAVFQRDNTEFFLNSPAVRAALMKKE